MAAIAYPSGLPGPRAAPITSVERRLLSADARAPRQSRTGQRDRLAVQDLAWPAMTADEAATFYTWWRDDLIRGGAWFAASWPRPQGPGVGVRRFIGTPQWKSAGGGLWLVSAKVEVRGAGELPQTPAGGDPDAEWRIPVYEDTDRIAFNDEPPAYIPWGDGTSGTDTSAAWGWLAGQIFVQRFTLTPDAPFSADWVPIDGDDWVPTVTLVDSSVYKVENAGSMFGWDGGVLTLSNSGSDRLTIISFAVVDDHYASLAWEYVRA
jgi:hypothetical protein